MRGILVLLSVGLSAFSHFAHSALVPRLVRDFNTNTESTAFMNRPFTVLNGVAYFQANDPAHGRELWRSDATEAGTWMVVDLQPGPLDSAPGYITVLGNQLFFAAAVGTNRAVLLKSDGTINGTFVMSRSFSGNTDTVLGELTAVGDRLFFYANDGVHSRELWISDGSEEGTRMVKDINAGPGESLPLFITDVGGKAVFRAWSTNGNEIWASDGTADGTILLKDIEPGAGSSYPDSFTILGTNLFFAVRNGTELWKTDGTPEGTVFVAAVGSNLPNPSIQNLTAVGTQLFFSARFNGDTELWRSDGTSNGTFRVANLNLGSSSFPLYITGLNGIAIFSATSDGYQLWRSDGTSAGTWPVKGTNGATVSAPSRMVAAGDVVYFAAAATGRGSELWRTDGTSNGTFLVKDISPGSLSSHPQVAAVLDGIALLLATTPEHGAELWRTDGTEAGTVLVKDINTRTAGSTLETIGAVDRTLFFTVGLAELWKTEGSASNTERLYTFSGIPGVYQIVSPGISYGDRLIFPAADTNGQGVELWESDGTTSGTRMLKAIQPGIGSSYPREFTRVGTTLFFAATGTNGLELWKTDGTEDGTVEVSDLRQGPASSYLSSLTEYQGALYFHAFHADGRGGLWRSDGTAPGSVRLVAFTNASFYGIQKAAGQLFVFVSEGTNVMLWASRGTVESTRPVGLVPVRRAIEAKNFAHAGRSDALLFTAWDAATGLELWRSDGTLAGTHLAKDIAPGLNWSSPSAFLSVGETIYFAANDGAHGKEIWRTDGTSGGTRLLRDIATGGPYAYGVSGYAFGRMAALNGLVFFWADEAAHGTELWVTDGSESGTKIVHDLYPLPQILYNPSGMRVLDIAGDRLFFIGDDGVTGRELWVLDVPRQPNLAVASRGGEIMVESNGEAGQTRVLENSTDLRFWTAISTNVAGADGSIRVTNAPAGANEFFRARAFIDY